MAGGMRRGTPGPSLAERSAGRPQVAAGPPGPARADPGTTPRRTTGHAAGHAGDHATGDTAAGDTAAGDTAGPPAGRAGAPGRRHCWVVDAPGHPGRYPGLLAEWRHAPDGGWQGRVVYAMTEPGGAGCRLVERWVDARWLALGPGTDG